MEIKMTFMKEEQCNVTYLQFIYNNNYIVKLK